MEFKEGVKVVMKKKVSSAAWGMDAIGNQHNNKQKLEEFLLRLKQEQKGGKK